MIRCYLAETCTSLTNVRQALANIPSALGHLESNKSSGQGYRGRARSAIHLATTLDWQRRERR